MDPGRRPAARLVHCLPGNSPPQRNLFDLCHEIHGPAVHGLPALLPEAWLHWDPKTVRARGPEDLFRQFDVTPRTG